MKGLWWKITGAAVFLYVLIGGMTVPLKPGITAVSPNHTYTGRQAEFLIEGYNTHFISGGLSRVWLKMDSTHILAHTVAEAVDENHLKASFSLPVTVPSEDQTIPLTLIIDNQEDGVFVQPNAVFLTRDTTDAGPSAEAWLQGRISDLHYPEGIKFPYRSILNETIRNTFFHVALWFAMFILLLAGVYHAFCYIRTHDIDHDTRSSAYTRVALLYGILGLVTGSVWARFTWDTFWTQDIKLNMTAIAMLIYLAYLLLRTSTEDVDKRARLSAAYNIFAFVALIPLVFVIPRLTDSLHPGNGGNPALGGEDLDNTLRLFFYPSILALTLLGLWMSSLLTRYERLRYKWIFKS